jgi:hypothetical protein
MYRYMSSKARYIQSTMDNMEIPANIDPRGTYISPAKFDSGSAARVGLQISPQWSDAQVRGEFDTLQLDDLVVPYGRNGSASYPEPLTVDYQEHGTGGYPQYITHNSIGLDNITFLPAGEMSIVLYGSPRLPMVIK